MAKGKGQEEIKRRLAALDAAGRGESGYEPVLEALADHNNIIVAKAAGICHSQRLTDAIEHLAKGYTWFFETNQAKRDPGCLAKIAIIKALYELDYRDAAFYRSNLHYTQMEAVWGSSEDTALEIRSTAVLGLVICHEPRVIMEVVELLADKEWPVRAAAVKALGALGSEGAEAVIRAKALGSDKVPEVIDECFRELLSLNAEEGPEFVARFLEDRDEALRDFAALALGESRLSEAVQILIDAWEGRGIFRVSREMLIQGLTLAYKEEAFAFLYEKLESAPDMATRVAVIKALAVYSYDDNIREEVERRVREMPAAKVQEAFAEAWG